MIIHIEQDSYNTYLHLARGVIEMSNSVLSFENEVFSKFAFYACLVLFKTVLMSLWTARHRIPKRVSKGKFNIRVNCLVRS